MNISKTAIGGVFLIDLVPIEDNRGAFARTFCAKEFRAIGFNKKFVQINHSYNAVAGTIRGMHFQYSPHQEIKLIRCISGKVLDVVVDIRKESPTYLRKLEIELSQKNKRMILIPEGCIHGFQTLMDDTELIYHHTKYYVAGSEGGIRYNDPVLGINWPLPAKNVSHRDESLPLIDEKFTGI